jgi:hypothetical protein
MAEVEDAGALVRRCVQELAVIEATARASAACGDEAGPALAAELRTRLEAAVREAERGLAALGAEREFRARELSRREEELRRRMATCVTRSFVLHSAGVSSELRERGDSSESSVRFVSVSSGGCGEPRCPTLAEADEEASSVASASEPDLAGCDTAAPGDEPPEDAWDESGYSDCDA